jgi:hypothetical protein
MSDTLPTPAEPQHFEYRPVAQAAGLSRPQLALLVRIFERDFPSDIMLRELHIFRACNAIVRGTATFDSLVAGAEQAA